MKTYKTRLTTLAALILVLLLHSASEAADTMPSESVVKRVHELLDAYAGADDLMDEHLLQKRGELEAMGETAYPVLCGILHTNRDPVYLSRVIEVFLRSKGDKNEPLGAVRNLLTTCRAEKYAPVHLAALKLLAEYGHAEDMELLADYARSENLATRTAAQKARSMLESRNQSKPLKKGELDESTNAVAVPKDYR